MYLLRLDDASEYMDIDKWRKMEILLDKYGVKPIFGIIPSNEDPQLLEYGKVEGFWEIIHSWIDRGWIPALHGYTHVFETEDGGINPVNNRSEFAGVSFERQCEKIRYGYKLLREKDISPEIFYAPAHTFDLNTLEALKQESDIRIINDTIATDTYYKDGFFFIPQQSGKCRKLPFKTVTFCYHPNTMQDEDYQKLELFLRENGKLFIKDNIITERQRKQNLYDILLRKIYFISRK